MYLNIVEDCTQARADQMSGHSTQNSYGRARESCRRATKVKASMLAIKKNAAHQLLSWRPQSSLRNTSEYQIQL